MDAYTLRRLTTQGPYQIIISPCDMDLSIGVDFHPVQSLKQPLFSPMSPRYWRTPATFVTVKTESLAMWLFIVSSQVSHFQHSVAQIHTRRKKRLFERFCCFTQYFRRPYASHKKQQ